ncbi:hypothetical protein [Spirosoma pulveris]
MQFSIQLGFVSLQVSDLEASRQFYTDVMRLQSVTQSPPDTYAFAVWSGAIFTIRKPIVDLKTSS